MSALSQLASHFLDLKKSGETESKSIFNTHLYRHALTIVKDLVDFIKRSPASTSIPLLLHIDLILRTQDTEPNIEMYGRGTLLYADFGVNIGHEFGLRRPCVVLKEGDNWAMVAPLSTSAKNHKYASRYMLNASYGLKENTAVLLEEMRKIDKRRIMNHFNPHGQFETPIRLTTADLNNIDNYIVRYYAPSTAQTIREIQQEVYNLQWDIDAYRAEIEHLNNQIEALKQPC